MGLHFLRVHIELTDEWAKMLLLNHGAGMVLGGGKGSGNYARWQFIWNRIKQATSKNVAATPLAVAVAISVAAAAAAVERLMNKQRSADRERMMETSVNNCSAGK